MSYTVFEACLDPGRRRCGAADLSTLLGLAAHVNQKDVERGWAWIAWPSQALLASELGLSERQLRRKLTNLKAAGDLRETGETKGRGIRVYEITLRTGSDVTTLDEDDPSLGPRSDLTRVDESDRGQIRPGDRTDPVPTPDIFGHDPGQICPTEPGEPNEPEMKPEVARASAREAVPPDDESFLSPYSPGGSRPAAQERAEELEDARELLRERSEAFDRAEVGTPEKQEAYRLKAEQEAVVARLEGVGVAA